MPSNILHVRAETKPLEHRTAITPTIAKKLVDAGYTVNVASVHVFTCSARDRQDVSRRPSTVVRSQRTRRSSTAMFSNGVENSTCQIFKTVRALNASQQRRPRPPPTSCPNVDAQPTLVHDVINVGSHRAAFLHSEPIASIGVPPS